MIGTQHTCNMPITLSILSLCDYYILCISYIICITCAINWKCSLYIQGGKLFNKNTNFEFESCDISKSNWFTRLMFLYLMLSVLPSQNGENNYLITGGYEDKTF